MYNIETRATKEELSVERSRIDSFTRLEEGSTTGDAELQDIRVMVDGTISDTAGNAVRTQINELKGDLGDLEKSSGKLFINLCDFSKFVVGKYYSSQYLNIVEDYEYCIYPLIELENNKTYTISDINGDFTWVSRTGNSRISFNTYLSTVEYTENIDGSITFTTDNITTGIYLTASRWNYGRVRFCLGNSIPPLAFNGSYFEKNKHNVYDIYVGHSYTRDEFGYRSIYFNNITGAINSIKNSDENHIYNVHIASGTYYIFNELGGTDYIKNISANDGERQGIVLPDYVNLIGNGTVVIDGRISDSDSTVVSSTCLSPINMWKHNKLENLIILAQNTRYCIHCESNNAFGNSDIEIRNCKCVHYGRTRSDLWASTQAFGGGSGSGARFNIINSMFKSLVTQGFSLHTNSYQKSNLLNIDGCYFEGGGTNPGIVLFSYGNNSEKGNCYFKNSKSIPNSLKDWTSEANEKTWNIFNYVDNQFQILD